MDKVTNVAIVTNIRSGEIIGVFHSETKDEVLSIAKSSLVLMAGQVGEPVQYDHVGPIDSGAWLVGLKRMTIRAYVSYGHVNHM